MSPTETFHRPITGRSIYQTMICYKTMHLFRVSGGNLCEWSNKKTNNFYRGVLSYIQTGGAVTINGSGSGAVTAATRAKLEIVNTGVSICQVHH